MKQHVRAHIVCAVGITGQDVRPKGRCFPFSQCILNFGLQTKTGNKRCWKSGKTECVKGMELEGLFLTQLRSETLAEASYDVTPYLNVSLCVLQQMTGQTYPSSEIKFHSLQKNQSPVPQINDRILNLWLVTTFDLRFPILAFMKGYYKVCVLTLTSLKPTDNSTEKAAKRLSER
jgi:hypothetical protein